MQITSPVRSTFVVLVGVAALCQVAALLPDGASSSPPGYTVVERQANDYTYNSQEAPSVAAAPDGIALVVWGSRRQEQATFGIYGRLFDSSGRAIGGELHLNQYLPNNQERPAVAFDRKNRAWVVWQSFGQDGDQGAIVLRRFGLVERRFTALGHEAVVNQITADDQTQPTVVTSGDRVLVTWTTVDGARQVVAARLYDLEGHPLCDEFRLGDPERDDVHEWLPTGAAQPESGFVVAWASRRLAGPPVGIFARRIDASGEPSGGVITLAAHDDRYDIEPSIDTDARGRITLAWMGANPDGGYDIYARRFDPDGTPLADEMIVPLGDADWRSGAALAVAPDGRFIVAANLENEIPQDAGPRKPDTPSNVAARLYDADGAPSGDVFPINQQREGRQTLTIATNVRRIVWASDDRIIAAWQGRTTADDSAVALTTLVPRALAIAPTDLTIEEALLAKIVSPDQMRTAAPPEYDPFHVRDPPDTPLNPGQEFGFIGFQNTGWTPPDPDIAVGPDHIVVIVNGGIRFFTKDGTLTFEDDISGSGGFWGVVGATHFVFDPVAVYDELSGRFIVVTTEHAPPNRDIDFLNIAVSDDSDPNGPWHKYRFDMDSIGDFIDFPDLGVGPDAIYVTTDFFGAPRGNWITIINKDDVMNGRSTTPNFVQTSTGIRSLGAITSHDTDQPAQYFATSFTGSSTLIQIDAVRDPLGTPIRNTFHLPVPFYVNPPRAEQLGSTNRVATVDRRIKHGVLRNGTLWLSHTIGQDNTARVRWYEIAMNGWPESGGSPQLVQQGTQNLGTGVHNWFPDIHVDDSGRVAVAFNQASAQEFVSVRRTFRLPSDPPGTLREPVLQQESTSPEPGSRWGDYGSIEPDPVDPAVFWNHHEYRTTSWRTWVGRFTVPIPAELTEFTVLDGVRISGRLPRLRESDDRYIEIEARVTGEVAQPHLMRARIIAVSDVENPDVMELIFESHITDVEGTVWLSLRNWRQDELVQVAEFAVGLQDEVHQVTVRNAGRFIRGSDGRIKLQIKKIVFFPFTLGGFHSLIDQVEINVR